MLVLSLSASDPEQTSCEQVVSMCPGWLSADQGIPEETPVHATLGRKQMRPSFSFGLRTALAALVMLLTVPASQAQQPIKVGIVTLLSGPAAGPFGVPARNAAELTA